MFTLEESRLLARMLRFVTGALTMCAGAGLLWYLRRHGLLPHLHLAPAAFRDYRSR